MDIFYVRSFFVPYLQILDTLREYIDSSRTPFRIAMYVMIPHLIVVDLSMKIVPFRTNKNSEVRQSLFDGDL